MEIIRTKTFQINIPEPFKHKQTKWESIRAEHQYEDEDDCAEIMVTLFDNGYYNKFKGGDFEERFYNCCKERRGEVEIIVEKTVTIGEATSYLSMAKSAYNYFYYFANLQINETYSYDFVGTCEADRHEFYTPLFEETWTNLQYFDGQEEAIKEQIAGMDELIRKASTIATSLGVTKAEMEEENKEISEIKDFQIPADGKEFFMVDDTQFEYNNEETNCLIYNIGNTGGNLRINLTLAVKNYQEYGHILNDYNDGEAYFSFSVSDIYQHGIPTGKFTFIKEYDSLHKISALKNGFHYSLNLFGELTLKAGWVGFNGYFQNIMQTKVYTVNIAKKIQTDSLQWKNYKFKSLQEASTVPLQKVHHLQITNLPATKFPDEIFNYTELESLYITYDTNFKGEKLGEIPKEIYKFNKLKDLSFYNLDLVKEIPVEIGQLKTLNTLNISGTHAKSIPAEALQLPILEHCNLTNNQLEEIPAQLPSGLKFLYLKNNNLKTLPASIVDLPQLKWLNIEDNPLQSLPENLEKIEHLILEFEKKHTLLKYEYEGADGLGAIAFDNEYFAAMNSAELKSLLAQQITTAGFEQYRKGLEMIALWSVALQTTTPDDYSKIGNSRFGGLPDLPKGLEYPTFTTYHGDTMGYQFIAQLECSALSMYQSFLPRHGMLYFFITDQESFKAKVIYCTTESVRLQSAKDLEIDESFIYDEHGIFNPFVVKADKYVSLPSFYHDDHLYHGDAANLQDLEEGDYDPIDKFRASLQPPDAESKFHSINSYVFKQNGSPQMEAANKLKGRPEDYIVLLAVSSDNNTGFSFWDAGEIYFVIHKSDLAKGNFSNIFCGLESS